MPPVPGHIVFVSYAVLDRSPVFRGVIQKFKELVRSKMGETDIDRVMFFDETSLGLGNEWKPQLAEALNKAETIACFLSPTYRNRLWCGRELEVFYQRHMALKESGVAPSAFIFPVIWELVRPFDLPKKLAAFQYMHASLPDAYVKRGLRPLADLKKHEDDYKEVLEAISDSIRDTLAKTQRLPPGPTIVDFETIPNAFEDPPETVTYGVLLATDLGDDEWRPSTNLPAFKAAVISAATALNSDIDYLPSAALNNMGLHKTELDRQILLVVTRAATTSSVHSDLVAINSVEVKNIALIIVDTEAVARDPATPEDWISKSKLHGGSFQTALDEQRAISCLPNQLASAIEALVTKVKLGLIHRDKGTKAIDVKLSEQAKANGYPTESPAMLTGLKEAT